MGSLCLYYDMIHFSLFGIPVRIEPWFWITLAFIGSAAGRGHPLGVFMVLVFILAGFVSILVHELGHAFTIRKYGLPTAISLIAFGGFASYPADVLSRKQSFLVTAAGPAIQIVLGVLAIAALFVLPMPPESLLRYFLIYLAWVSIVWAILNCLPIYPMDGGQMLAAVLGPKRQKYVYLIGVFCAVFIGAMGYLVLNAWLLLIFMGFFAWKNWMDFQQSHQAGNK